MSINNPVNAFLEQYRMAAAEGAIVELKLRLLADKVPALQRCAHENLQGVESEVIKHFGNLLSDEDKQVLELCRKLRNKVLHCDFRAARDKLEELGVEVRRGGVKKIKLQDAPGSSLLEKVQKAISGESTSQYVADTSSTAPGSVYGWLLELGSAGAFVQAADAFKNASSIIDRLAAL